MVFGCISKNFPENIFWCLEMKKENTNPEKHKPQPRKKSSTTTLNSVRRPRCRSRSEIAIDGAISRSVDRDLGSSSLAYIRDLAPSIAINGAISWWRDRDQQRLECLPARSRHWSWLECLPLIAIGMFAGNWRSRSRACALSLSLSLSHFPEILWRENKGVKWFPWSKAFFFGQQISISGK